HLDSIPAFKAEYFSEYNNVTMKLDVSLRGFDKPSDKSYSPYDDFNKSLNAVYNVSYTGKDAKSLKLTSEKLGINPKKSTIENIRKIENYVKTEIAISPKLPMTLPMAEMLKNERAGSIGAILIYMALFHENDIRFEYGFISDR